MFGRWPKNVPLQRFSPEEWSRQRPTHSDADPGLIAAALRWSQQRPSGNWYTFAASREIGRDRPFGTSIGGVELVAWRDERNSLHVGPGACPHLGAPLAEAQVDDAALICRWHGLRVEATGRARWRAYPSYDDGVLVWVRLDTIGEQPPTDAPIIGSRPADTTVHAVTSVTGVCEPRDIIANRLDPWHGSWLHPYSFTRLEVAQAPPRHDITEENHRFLLTVTFRVTRRLGVPVEAEFTCPDPRTIVMRIVSGEGTGSVIETHATPLGPGSDGRPRTAVIEAVIANSQRPGFRHARRALPVLRPLMTRAATRLWRDDLAYAERRYRLRTHQL
ncbi:Rieske (2Fe-2S) protein [Streptomyces gardneri]|nr:Rieske (2Fe-2S) protein [Streptomyces gardneri]